MAGDEVAIAPPRKRPGHCALVVGLLGQDEPTHARGLQAIDGAVVNDADHFASPQQFRTGDRLRFGADVRGRRCRFRQIGCFRGLKAVHHALPGSPAALADELLRDARGGAAALPSMADLQRQCDSGLAGCAVRPGMPTSNFATARWLMSGIES